MVNVYSLPTSTPSTGVKGKDGGAGILQMTVPFKEKITAILYVDPCGGSNGDRSEGGGGGFLVLGTAGGGLLVWELLSGRVVSTVDAHLNAVTSLASSRGGRGLDVLSGSADGNIHVWSVATILAMGDVGKSMEIHKRAPIRTLRGHKDDIVGIVTGRVGDSHGGRGIAISAAKDDTACIWEHGSGTLLRTILLPLSPTCLTIDPCDRAAYFGFSDGTVTSLDFFKMDGEQNVKNAIFDEQKKTIAVQISTDSLWKIPGENIGSCLSMDVSYDGTKLMTGYDTGKVVIWDIPTRRYVSQLTAMPFAGPVTNLRVLPLQSTGSNYRSELEIRDVIKPRFGEIDAHDGQLPPNYKISAHLVGDITTFSHERSDFERCLDHSSYPDDILADGINEMFLYRQKDDKSIKTNNGEADFMALDADQDMNGKPALEEENQRLKKQIASLQRLQQTTFKQINELRKGSEQ